jgi:O-antigen/teichoic acid export membrane protein
MLLRGESISSGRICVDDIKSFLRFGLPLVPNNLALWMQRTGIKPVLTQFVPLAGVGLFSFASAIAFMPLMLTVIIDQIVAPLYFKRRVDGASDLDAKIRTLAVLSLAGCFVFASGMILFSLEAVKFVGGHRYAAAAPSCALLSCAMFLRSSIPFFSRQIQYARNTLLFPLVTIPCAGLAVGLVAMLSSRFGFQAAAYAVLISEVAMIIGYGIAVCRIEPIQVPIKLQAGLFAVLLVLAFGFDPMLQVFSWTGTLGFRILAFAAFATITYAALIRPNLKFIHTVLKS